MFPTTMWSTIRQAGAYDREALERFASRYRPAIAEYLRTRGLTATDADDICQEVFIRLLGSKTLAMANPDRGRFRSLMLAVTRNVLVDHYRRLGRAPTPTELVSDLPAERDADFDRTWILHLAQAAMDRLRDERSPYFEVLREHLAGVPQDRNRLWNARRKLIAYIRHEISLTCTTQAEFDDESAYLSAFLAPGAKRGPRPADAGP